MMDSMERRYHENGKIQFECPLRDGVRDGACKEFYESGAVRRSVNYHDGLQEGPEEIFSERGRLICRHIYKNGRVVDSFVPIVGRVGNIDFYEYWEKGRCRSYDRHNRLFREFGRLNDSYDGLFREFYANGRVATEMFYNAGNPDGFAKYWSRDGLKCNVDLFIDGEECGSKKMEYFENGMLSKEIGMNGDLPDGLEISYHENGVECMRVVYEMGMAKDGPVNFIDEDGELTLFSHWENNTSKTYSEDGKLQLKAVCYRDMYNGKCTLFEEDGPKDIYYFDDDECKSKEEFLEKTFNYLAEKLERSLSRFSRIDAETLKKFYENQYEKIMKQENSSEEFFNYEELLCRPEKMDSREWIVRLAVREFMLRLRLPNDGPTEEGVVNALMKLAG